MPLSNASSLRLVWPTAEQVRTSNQGWAAGGSIPGRAECVHHAALVRLWARWGGEATGRGRAMPHVKSYCRYLCAPSHLPNGLCFWV